MYLHALVCPRMFPEHSRQPRHSAQHCMHVRDAKATRNTFKARKMVKYKRNIPQNRVILGGLCIVATTNIVPRSEEPFQLTKPPKATTKSTNKIGGKRYCSTDLFYSLICQAYKIKNSVHFGCCDMNCLRCTTYSV